MNTIQYDGMREKTNFSWYVNASSFALATLAGVTLHDIFTNYKAAIKMYDDHIIEKYLSHYDRADAIKRPAISTPAVSYGHLNGVGVPLVFPEGNGDVNYERTDYTLDEWIEILDQERDFSKEGMLPYFLDYREKLKEAFPGKPVGFGCSYEGPITEAYTMLDLKLYYSLYDEPEKLKKMLEKVSYSVIRYKKFISKINRSNYAGMSGMCDDCAAIIAPDMWEEFVIPFMEIIYADTGATNRSLHSEDLVDKHLKHLETLGITRFDPSVSPKLTPPIIANECRVPFVWRLANIYDPLLDRTLAQDFVFAAVRDGASGAFTSANHLDEHSINVVTGFIEGCEAVDDMLAKGATREQIGDAMSDKGKTIFWGQWRRLIGG